MLTEAELPAVDAVAPELSGFDRDLVAYFTLWDDAVPSLQSQAESGNNARIALINVAQDYYWRAYDHGVGAAILLHDSRPIPFLAVQRALYETMVTLNYLATHKDPEREAQIAIAHQPIHEFWQYREYGLLESDIPRLNAAKRRITELPFKPDILEAARERESSYRWTGKKFEQLVKMRNHSEYHFGYGRLSATVHPDQRQIAQHMAKSSPAWYEARAVECRYFLREVRRLMSITLGLPFSNWWFDQDTTPAVAPGANSTPRTYS